MILVIGVAGLVLGLLVGLWLFKVKSRWCPTCGDWTLERPLTEEEARLIREVVQANDPARNVPVYPPRVSAAELRRRAAQS